MKKNNQGNILGKTMYVIILLLLLAIVFGGVFYINSNKSSETFEVEVYHEIVSDYSDQLIFDNSEPIYFKVNGSDNFKVRIVPNVAKENDFTFKINGSDVQFSYISDELTSCFNVLIQEDGFVIDFRDNSLVNILEQYYPYYKISDIPSPKKDVSYFDLIIVNEDTKDSITIALNSLMSVRVQDIILSDEVINL